MLVVETVAKIRRAYFVQHKTIKAICRELRVSRKVVRKVLRSEATEFRYERGEQPLPRIGPWQDALDRMLATNEAKPSRERLTLIRIFEALRGVGYEGGYDAVRRYARSGSAIGRRPRWARSFLKRRSAHAGPGPCHRPEQWTNGPRWRFDRALEWAAASPFCSLNSLFHVNRRPPTSTPIYWTDIGQSAQESLLTL